jgi:hypothetical protein
MMICETRLGLRAVMRTRSMFCFGRVNRLFMLLDGVLMIGDCSYIYLFRLMSLTFHPLSRSSRFLKMTTCNAPYIIVPTFDFQKIGALCI